LKSIDTTSGNVKSILGTIRLKTDFFGLTTRLSYVKNRHQRDILRFWCLISIMLESHFTIVILPIPVIILKSHFARQSSGFIFCKIALSSPTFSISLFATPLVCEGVKFNFDTPIRNVKPFLKRVSFIAILGRAGHFYLKFLYIILTLTLRWMIG
jgi:hypothetical protein